MNDLELLRRHEPILRFTAGELFYPSAVDGYVSECSLLMRDPGGRDRELIAQGALDLDRLADQDDVPPGHSLSLRFVAEPLAAKEYQRWRRRPGRVHFRAPGRLSRVPPWSRILDAGFDLSLLVRGTVPGGTTAAAEVKCRALREQDDRRVYYGRVYRGDGWTALQYWFFYAMNDWRSTFHGVNDHEADWEQMLVYLYETEDGALEPRWVAYSSHEYHGDDIRRRWDDSLLDKEGLHPVVFTAAGSHASYFERGEYVMGVEPRFLTPVKRGAASVRRFWVETLGQGIRPKVDRQISALVSIPFVDYARGDGLVVGPGGDVEWSPIVISDDVSWVDRYRGLWGLDTQDPFGGERAPAGPKYNRDGSVRLSWYDPVAFAGLSKILPPPKLAPTLEQRKRQLATELEEIDATIAKRVCALRTLELDEVALRVSDYSGAAHKQTALELGAAETALRSLEARRNRLIETRAAVASYAGRVKAGIPDDPRAHLHDARHPDPPAHPGGVLQVWAALSGGVALLAVVVLLVVFPSHLWFWGLAIGVAFAAVEAAAEGRLLSFLLGVTVVLAVITALILIREHWRVLLVGTLGIVIAVMMRENLRELASNRGKR